MRVRSFAAHSPDAGCKQEARNNNPMKTKQEEQRQIENPFHKHECKKCGWVWWSRLKDPVSCPKCKRYDWREGK